MNGILLVDKPADWTSHDVVAKVRGILERELRQQGEKRRVKVGHAGTLDPFATGLLVILVGSATKQAQQFLKLDKSYEVEMIMGARSSTDDKEGQITQQEVLPWDFDEPKLTELINSFVGEIEQVPPKFSAIKVKGKRAYKSARKGEDVELKPRKVKIYLITDIVFDHPKVSFNTKVGSGTYIRSLARDIGWQWGVGGYVENLRRTAVGKFSINDTVVADQLNYEIIQKCILPLD